MTLTRVHYFPSLCFQGFLSEYKPSIRVSVAWDELMDPEPQVEQLWFYYEDQKDIFFPFYKGKMGWRGGKPKHVTPGECQCLVRAPAVDVGDQYVLLDGTHRIRELRPELIILDCLKPRRKSQFRAFVDCWNESWQPWK